MAQLLTNCFIKVDEDEYSGLGTNVAISMSAESQELRTFGSTTVERVSGGIIDWSVAMEFNADESVTGRFFDLVGKAVDLEIKPKNEARSEANPSYVGTAVIENYDPLSGAVGEVHTVSLSMVAAGPLRRLTDPADV